MQGDALAIRARAKRRLADEYDAAQARGEIGKHGGARSGQVSGSETWRATEAVSPKQIHEARCSARACRGSLRARAKCRLADEYDAAQARGEVALSPDDAKPAV